MAAGEPQVAGCTSQEDFPGDQETSEQVAPHLFSFLDPPIGADDDFVSSLKSHHFSHTVRCTRVVDVPASHHAETADRKTATGALQNFHS